VIAALVLTVATVGVLAGVLVGFHVGTVRTKDALKLARYEDAIALADDLVKTPDALDLRSRAQSILTAHRAANSRKEP
jgi:hypothetical protein